jgi:large conductance mechanosensitive channel
MSMMSEFRAFAVKGNVVDLAVAVIIGAAFSKIVDSLVKDLVMPIVGAIFGGLDFSNYFIPLTSKIPENVPYTYEALTKAGVPLFAYGNFVTVLLNFIILAFIIFQMVRLVTRAQRLVIAPQPAAAPPTAEEVLLLREIRDSLRPRV